MLPRYEPVTGLSYFFADDGSGVATRCELSGDTHFFQVDPAGFRELLSRPTFGLDDLRKTLKTDDETETRAFAERLVTLGIIDEID